MVFYHPKKYKELHGLTSRKCNTRQRAQGSLPANGASTSDQAISQANSTRGLSGVRSGPGLKHQASSDKQQASSESKPEPVQVQEASSAKRQASQSE